MVDLAIKALGKETGMQLVIDIDENIYHRFVNGFANEGDAYLIEQLFKNGTLLPGGHGRLGDLDKFENHLLFLDKTISESTVVGQAEHRIVMEILESTMKVPTIIEADKGDTE